MYHPDLLIRYPPVSPFYPAKQFIYSSQLRATIIYISYVDDETVTGRVTVTFAPTRSSAVTETT